MPKKATLFFMDKDSYNEIFCLKVLDENRGFNDFFKPKRWQLSPGYDVKF